MHARQHGSDRRDRQPNRDHDDHLDPDDNVDHHVIHHDLIDHEHDDFHDHVSNDFHDESPSLDHRDSANHRARRHQAHDQCATHNTNANAAINPSVVVTVQDAAGYLVATNTATVTLTILSGTGSPAGRLTCTANPKVAIAGVVTFSTCAISKTANNYKLTATSPGLTSSVSTSFNIT